MHKYVKSIKFCRVCKSKNLLEILSLGDQFISDFVNSNGKGVKAPLDLVLCNISLGGCGLLQLKHTVSSDLLYKKYWYRSGINKTMSEALSDIITKVEKLINLSDGDIVLDIGCNDGTLLRSYYNKKLILAGFEPASNLINFAQVGTTKIINAFFNSASFENVFGAKKAKVITSIAMFYDLDDPNVFVDDITKCLDENGIWVIQMSYLPSMLKQNAFDNICHEHLEYYSLMSLKNLLDRHNLNIFDVELNDINGGSFRVYIKRNTSKMAYLDGASESLAKLQNFESSLGLDKKDIYNEFSKEVKKIKKDVVSFIRNEKKKGRKIYVYGASTKGNVLLQFFDLNNELIDAAIERNPDKFGKKTVGSLIPIISEEQGRAENPDYFLILPWHFLTEFLEREKDYLLSGGKFIVPLPEFKIIDDSYFNKK